MQQPELIQLFATPLLISKYPKDLTKELEFVKNLEYKRENKDETGQLLNHQSSNTFLFDAPELQEVVEFVNAMLQFYVKNIMECKDELIVTQSWSNKTKQGERHHEHSHPNSIISGVFYLQNNKNLPPIQFRRQITHSFSLNVEKHNNFNSATYLLPAENGELLLFPSTLTHSVLDNKSDEDRISIAFNTFTKGSLGSIDSLTYLPIDRCV
jgi:uncharacterized protein (TIGR02466 family)